MEHLITHQVLQYGYLAVFVLMVAESACIPIPSEITMLFGGALANTAFLASLGQQGRHLNFVTVALLGAAGNLVGSWIAWAVGYRGGRPLIDHFGRYILLRPHEVDRAEAWFQRHGEAAVFVSRLLPVVRTFISLPAGVARMRLGRFSLYTLAGLGSQWQKVERWMHPVSYAVAVLLLLAIAWWYARRGSQQRRPLASSRHDDVA